jgi:(1->4)-alpha-D-glucan 1-alpha-D-glucosylmutase
VLSEVPRPWCTRAERWALLNRRLHRADDAGNPLPDASTEYLFYQTLLGVWPPPGAGRALPDDVALADLCGRVVGYMQKAAREAKLHTAWTNADTDYEAALEAFVAAAMDPDRSEAFLSDFADFARPVIRLGQLNSLSMALLRLTAPGVPDLYQGTELWMLSLVDPDNRRPVDFEQRRALLRGLPDPDDDGAPPPDWHRPDGLGKLHLIHRALALRAADPALFADGAYRPLRVAGPLASHLCAFARTHQGRALVVLAPRLLARLALQRECAVADHDEARDNAPADPFAHPGWDATLVEVPGRRWLDRLGAGGFDAATLDGRSALRAADVLRRFPVGLLTRADDV